MKHTALYLLATILLFAVGCEDLHFVIKDNNTYELTASVDEDLPETRVGFDFDNVTDGIAPFFWTKGDAIAVPAKLNDALGRYVTSDPTGSTTATFTGYVKATGYAVYPYEYTATISNDKLEYRFPREYAYESVDADFFKGMSVSVPMLAKLSEGDNSAKFKHLGGVIAFKVRDLAAGNEQKFIITSDQQIAGLTYTDLSVDVPEIKTNENPRAEEREVTINFSLAEDQDAVFYLPVPVGKYNIGIKLLNGNGEKTFETGWKNLNVSRAKILYTNLNPDDVQGGGESGGGDDNVEGGEGDVTFESGNATVDTVTPDADGNATFSLPKAEGDASQPHTLTFSNIADGVKTIEIQEQDNVAGNPIENLNIAIPKAAGEIDLKIDLPNTTVTLVPENGSLSLGNVEASTAENTLKIGSGVSINKLIIKKGNVVVADGANISAIEKHQYNSAAVAYAYFEKTKPSLTATGVELLTFEEHLRAGIEAGGEVKILGDITLNSSIIIPSGKAVVLNLNGYAISGKSTSSATSSLITVKSGANLTIKDGSVVFYATSPDTQWGGEGQPPYPGYANNTIKNEGALTIENAHIENMTQRAGASYVIDNYNGASLVVNEGSVITQTGGDTAIRMFNGSAGEINVTINGGQITGYRAVWIQCASNNTAIAPGMKLTINGGTLSSLDANYNLAIYSYSYGNDLKNVLINISGGIFNGDIALTGGTNKTNIETLNISGGTFKGKEGFYSYGEDEKAVKAITVTGGSFPNDPTPYVPEGYSVEQSGDKYIVK